MRHAAESSVVHIIYGRVEHAVVPGDSDRRRCPYMIEKQHEWPGLEIL